MIKILRHISLILAVVLVFALAGCKEEKETVNKTPDTAVNEKTEKEEVKELDYDAMINSFVSDSLNTFKLKTGETHFPEACIWLENSGGTVYTSDESIVTVSEMGEVTAVSEGSAYVIISAQNNSVSAIYRYDVQLDVTKADLSALPAIEGVDFALEIERFEPTPINTFEIKIGETDVPPAAVWASEGSCYTSDYSVATVAEDGTVIAVGKGTAYVVIKAGVGNMFKIYKYVVSE